MADKATITLEVAPEASQPVKVVKAAQPAPEDNKAPPAAKASKAPADDDKPTPEKENKPGAKPGAKPASAPDATHVALVKCSATLSRAIAALEA